MPNGILKLSPATPPADNIGAVHLGVVKLPVPVSEDISILQAGMPPLQNLALDLAGITMSPPGWASITLVVLGVQAKPGVMMPIPLETGLPVLPWPPPPGMVLVFPPGAPLVAAAALNGVTVIGAARVVGLPMPGMPDPVIPPGVIDCFALPGTTYSLKVIVVPTGALGLHTCTIPLVSDAGPLGKIVISAVVIDPLTPESE